MFDFDDEFDEQITGFTDYSFQNLPRQAPILDTASEAGSAATTITTAGSIQG